MAPGAALHDDPEKVVERAQVLHRELGCCVDRALEENDTGHREHDVVKVEEEVDDVVAMPKVAQGCVRHVLNEAKGDQVGDKATVPGLRRLLEAIQRVVKLTHHTQAS
jgi:hypothetical protein